MDLSNQGIDLGPDPGWDTMSLGSLTSEPLGFLDDSLGVFFEIGADVLTVS